MLPEGCVQAQRLPDSATAKSSDSAKGYKTTVDERQSFPTASKERQQQQRKADKEKGIERVVQKRIQKVEDHHDDCGEDLSSIVKTLDHIEDTDDKDLFVHFDDDTLCDNLALYMFYGCSAERCSSMPNLLTVRCSNIQEAITLLLSHGRGFDIAEVCGGEARTTTLAVRRRLKAGPNFDLTTDINLCDPKDIHFTLHYFRDYDVLVAVMAPVCTPYGPAAAMNWYRFPETMEQRLAEARPLAWITGTIRISCASATDCYNDFSGFP